jgi:hypothetical protein
MSDQPDDIEVTPDMLAAGFKMLVDSGVLNFDEKPITGALLPYGGAIIAQETSS